MATNEQNLPPEAGTTGGTGAAGGAASAFERPVPPIEQPEVAISPMTEEPAVRREEEPRNRLESASRSAGHYIGAAVGGYRSVKSEGFEERAARMVREHPWTLGAAAIAGYIVGRVLRKRM